MKKILLLAAAAVAMTAAADDYYVIGDNVNGNNWALAMEDAKMTDLGDGVYEWRGNVLGSGFKINDGTWSNPEKNFGGTAGNETLTLGEPFYYTAGESSSNIGFEQGPATVVNNPVVILNVNDETITVTGEEEVGQVKWYFVGSVTSWDMDESTEMEVNGKNLSKKNVALVDGQFLVACTGWGTKYGAGHPEAAEGEDPEADTEISAEAMSGTLYNNGADCICHLEGNFDIDVTIADDDATALIVFSAPGEGGVEGVELNDAEAVYYTLDGVRVENPVSGIYVKVAGKKAAKVLVAE